METREYALGTSVTVWMPWSLFTSARAICSDGVVRATSRMAFTADTFFSIPCTVRVKGKSVAGYVTIETADGWSTATDADPATVKFVADTSRKNGGLLPPGVWKRNPEDGPAGPSVQADQS